MFRTLINAFRDKDVRKRILMTLAFILVYSVGCFIMLPGLDAATLESITSQTDSANFLAIISQMTGGALANGSILALGIVPYINAFIIMQLLSLIIPPLERLTKEGGEEGKKKVTQYTRYLAILLAAVQAIGVVISWGNEGAVLATFNSTVATQVLDVLILIGGSVFVMWLAERITEYGIGNGTSILIFIGIVLSTAINIINSFQSVGDDINNLWYIFGYLAMMIVVFFFIVFVDLSERRITVQYAKQVKGNKMYGGQNAQIPIKINASGVMPIIFASAFLMFPQMIASFWPDSAFYQGYVAVMGVGQPLYAVLMSLLIIFFSYFYAQIQFNPEDVARNIQSYGGFIPGIRPGKPTGDYLRRINNRITLFGALFLALIALIPNLVFNAIGTNVGIINAFSATGLLIMVSVSLELNRQLESQVMMRHYKGFLK